MATQEMDRSIERETDGPTPFDVRHTAAILVSSFRFSQGEAALQESILFYLATNFESQFNSDTIDQAVDGASKLASSIRHDATRHKKTFTSMGAPSNGRMKEELKQDKSQIKQYADVLKGYLDGSQRISLGQDSVGYLIRATIDRDYKHLRIDKDEAGRYRAPSSHTTLYNDPFLSFWTYHGLMEGGTGMAEYDAMFSDMKAGFIENQGYTPEYAEKSATLVGFHLRHHAQQAGRLASVHVLGANYQAILEQS